MALLEHILGAMEGQGLIHPASPRSSLGEELEYLFKHVLVQEAAYASLLKQDRRRLHLAVGEALEREAGTRVEDIAPILAHHFEEGEDSARALRYYMQAGDSAARRHAEAEACMLFGRALQIALQSKAPSGQLTEIHLRYGRMCELTGDYAGALASYVDMGAHAEERHDPTMMLAALMARATVHSAPTTLFDPALGEQLALRALALAESVGDRKAEAKARWLLCLALRFTDRIGESSEHGTAAARLSRELGMREQLAYVLNDLFPVYMTTQRAEEARGALIEARQLAQDLDNAQLLVDVTTNVAELELFSGRLAEAESIIDQNVKLADRIGTPWGQSYSRWVMGILLAERGEFGSAIGTFDRSIALGAQAGFAFSQIAVRAMLATLYADVGAYHDGIATAQLSLVHADRLRPEMRGGALAALGLCYLGLGEHAQSRAALVAAQGHESMVDMSNIVVAIAASEIELASHNAALVLELSRTAQVGLDRMGMHLYQPLVDYFRGSALLLLGQLELACESLDAGVRSARALGARRHLWRMLLTSASCHLRRGDAQAGAAMRAEAQAEVQLILNYIDSPGLRASFEARVARLERELELDASR